ncbi:uncharacterized protein LOC106674019 [Cimex lectularius]|uniref:Uncharacterized protein n=1 Tax=Cimex lectularius TaxID=79782 RepID=A0A8I6SAA1_CIMLE|nr:uncharacterized protein LOC106674019 [Cimex lectularius]
MEVQQYEGGQKKSCSTVEMYDEDYYTLKLRDMAKGFGWKNPQYNIKPEKNPRQLCVHGCEVTVYTTSALTGEEYKEIRKFPNLKSKYEFDTGKHKFLIPYEAMDYVAKVAYYTLRELTGGGED